MLEPRPGQVLVAARSAFMKPKSLHFFVMWPISPITASSSCVSRATSTDNPSPPALLLLSNTVVKGKNSIQAARTTRTTRTTWTLYSQKPTSPVLFRIMANSSSAISFTVSSRGKFTQYLNQPETRKSCWWVFHVYASQITSLESSVVAVKSQEYESIL